MASSEIAGISDLDPNSVFEILTKLGEGSYGTVYKALDLRDSSIVAIKVIGIEPGENWESVQREINILKECKSEYIVAYKGIFEDSNQYLWIVMEYCDAGSVLDLMSICDMRTLEEDMIAVILAMCLKALDYLHKHKKIHRDIKSGNLLLTHRGICKLADFGVSAELGHTMSKRKTLIGTPYWMAPEVLKGDLYDSKADIWSLAITAIEMATGDPPLYEIHPMKVIFQIPSLPAPTLPNPEKWSPQFHEFLASCLQKDPNKRPSAAELLANSPFIRNAKSQALVAELVHASMEEIEQFREHDSVVVVELTEQLGLEEVEQVVQPEVQKAKPSGPTKTMVHMGTVRAVMANSCSAVASSFAANPGLLKRGKCLTCGKPPNEHPSDDHKQPCGQPVREQQQQFMQKHLKQLEDKYKGQARRQEAEARTARVQHAEQMRQLELLRQKYVKAAEAPRISMVQQQAREQQLEKLKQKYIALGKREDK